MKVPFNRPTFIDKELDYIHQAVDENHHLSGNGPFTRRCQEWLVEKIGCQKALLTHSCTAALDMTALLLNLQPGDEVIMPSFTFVSTANAFALRGAVPVFVDIRADTCNIDEKKIEGAITTRTKAIVVVHYGGVGCDMDAILAVARRHRLYLIEDAAQGLASTYKGRPLGAIGDFGVVSFHETKNVISGEGGALLINNERYNDLAEIVWEKGTDRMRFLRGEVNKYTWQHLGSSYLPSELTAAFLCAQLESADQLIDCRLKAWERYHAGLARLEQKGQIRRPIIPDHCQHNGHMYYILLPDNKMRDDVLEELRKRGINALFHYVPLHQSPAGKRFCRMHGRLTITENIAKRIIRLPIWHNISIEQIDHVVTSLVNILDTIKLRV